MDRESGRERRNIMKKLLVVLTVTIFLTGCSSKFPPPAQWQPGQERASEGEWQGKKGVSWFQSFKLPKKSDVISYLERSGLKIGRIEPIAYEENDKQQTATYEVYAVVPTKLFKMASRQWLPKEKELQPFGSVIVFNPGLPAGYAWDTEAAQVAAEAGKKVTLTWRITTDRTYNVTTTDVLQLGNNLFTEQQVNDARAQTAQAISALQNEVAQIKAKIAEFKSAQLAQVPADPPAPEMLSKKWGGSGSGEPTKTGMRTLGGAATGAAIGGLAGGGEGAGIGAGAGLLGGLIYDVVSKSNDREKFEKAVDAENSNRIHQWKAQKRELAARRAEIGKQAAEMENQMMSQLAAKIVANSGRVGEMPSEGQSMPFKKND